MRIRYTPTLPGNVSDLVDHAKRTDGARLGPTTIRAGEPGIVLRSADGTRVIGSLRNGSLEVNVRGAVQDIRNVFAEDRDSIDYLESERRKLWSTATNHEQRISDNRSSIGFLDQQREKLWSTVNNHESRIGANRSSITYLDNSKASNGALAVERGRISSLDQSKASNSRVDGVAGTASAARSAASSAQSAADSAAAAARAARVYAESLEGRLAYLENRIREMT